MCSLLNLILSETEQQLKRMNFQVTINQGDIFMARSLIIVW